MGLRLLRLDMVRHNKAGATDLGWVRCDASRTDRAWLDADRKHNARQAGTGLAWRDGFWFGNAGMVTHIWV